MMKTLESMGHSLMLFCVMKSFYLKMGRSVKIKKNRGNLIFAGIAYKLKFRLHIKKNQTENEKEKDHSPRGARQPEKGFD
ncbi:hypothetical protein [Gaoshiqia sp. Z1-71]|uniref:hypothetical protein n=1 Tax=Gaoshiqia hydrogeniformans TaxID=3290090 RepID=UPI003BF8476A